MNIKQTILGLQHIGIPTNDLEKTIAFYESLGFSVVMRTVNEAAGEQVAFLRLQNLTIETYQNNAAVGTSGAVDHFAMDVSDIESAFACIRELGYQTVHEQIQYLPFWEKGIRFFIVIGPNGEKVEFSQIL